jgi:hypothetical protein
MRLGQLFEAVVRGLFNCGHFYFWREKKRREKMAASSHVGHAAQGQSRQNQLVRSFAETMGREKDPQPVATALYLAGHRVE